ncbi:MAG: hypothetical protein GY866_42885 [Proteobacteria bacterium]|nr:hypothetical protein [Pseudomonadota bacterium]
MELSESDQSFGKVMVVKPPVYVVRSGKELRVDRFGMFIREGDSIVTGKEGIASILLSLISEGNQMYLMPTSKISLNKELASSEMLIYNIRINHGKIRAKLQITYHMQVRIDTDVAEITTNDADIVVENINEITRAGTVEGMAILNLSATRQSTNIPQGKMTTVGYGLSSRSLADISEELLDGTDMEKIKEEIEEEKKRLKREKQNKLDAERLRIETIKQQYQDERKRKVQEGKRKLEAEKLKQEEEKRKLESKKKQRLQEEKQRKETEKRKMLASAVKEKMPQKFETMKEEIVDEIAESLESKERSLRDYTWHIAATSTILVSAWLSTEEANEYNSLDSKNDQLTAQYTSAKANSDDESAALLYAQHEVNKEKMKQNFEKMTLYNNISYLAMAWEGYLLYRLFFSSGSDKTSVVKSDIDDWRNRIVLQPVRYRGAPAARLSVGWRW